MGTTGSGASLSVLDQRLEAHFAALRSERDEEAGSELPVFAFEHGLSELERSLLSTAVREAVGRGHLPIIASLPFVVYAAEVGYDYSGDEYWQTFSQRTPGWSQIEDRDFIRQGFQRFASLAVDAAGNICVATLVNGSVSVIAPDGRLLRQAPIPDMFCTNICFGGPALRTAYMTLSGTWQLVAMQWPEPGLRLAYEA